MGDPVSFKVVLLGEGRVGKTSLFVRYIQNEFDSKQQSTIQATHLDKRINVDGQSLKLVIWDTAGQERFHALGPIYYRDANGALLVYDITDRESFDKVRNWVKELRKIVGEDIALLIAGNKSDMEKNRQVSEEVAVEYAKSVNATHLYTSAKTGKGVAEAFMRLAQDMLKRHNESAKTRAGTNSGKRNFVQIVETQEKSNSGCCS